jgi:hypothetical protein
MVMNLTKRDLLLPMVEDLMEAEKVREAMHRLNQISHFDKLYILTRLDSVKYQERLHGYKRRNH